MVCIFFGLFLFGFFLHRYINLRGLFIVKAILVEEHVVLFNPELASIKVIYGQNIHMHKMFIIFIECLYAEESQKHETLTTLLVQIRNFYYVL